MSQNGSKYTPKEAQNLIFRSVALKEMFTAQVPDGASKYERLVNQEISEILRNTGETLL